jgi:hypothetical protein
MAKQQKESTLRGALVRHRLLPSIFVALSLSFGSMACSKAPQQPPASPLKQAKKDERIQQEDELDPQRRHLAPPPAYGNKVVMAKSGQDRSTNF